MTSLLYNMGNLPEKQQRQRRTRWRSAREELEQPAQAEVGETQLIITQLNLDLFAEELTWYVFDAVNLTLMRLLKGNCAIYLRPCPRELRCPA